MLLPLPSILQVRVPACRGRCLAGEGFEHTACQVVGWVGKLPRSRQVKGHYPHPLGRAGDVLLIEQVARLRH